MSKSYFIWLLNYWTTWWRSNSFPFTTYVSWCLYVTFENIWFENCIPYFKSIVYSLLSKRSISDMHRRGLIQTLLRRSCRLSSNYVNFHQETEAFNSILKHSYCINYFLNKLFIQKKLSFFYHEDFTWFHLKSKAKSNYIKRDLPECKLKAIFRSKWKLNNLFRFKDSPEKKICSGILHCHTCSIRHIRHITFYWNKLVITDFLIRPLNF